jgi:hypothetical protein
MFNKIKIEFCFIKGRSLQMRLSRGAADWHCHGLGPAARRAAATANDGD